MLAVSKQGSWVQERFPEVVGGLVIGGLGLTMAELILMGHTEGKQMLGVILCGVAMGALALGLFVGAKLRKVLAGLLFVLALGGIFGTVEHLEEAAEHKDRKGAKESRVEVQAVDFDREGDREHREHREHKEGEEEHGPPPLAPLSVSGLALMGGLGLIASRR